MTKQFSILFAFSFTCFLLSGCKKNESSQNKKDPNGNWLVSLDGGVHCLAPAASRLVTVTNGQFNATIVTWGSSRLSIQGTITMGNIYFIVSGNETISGPSCNGSNGFYDYIDPNGSPVAGTVSSNWGTLRFEKQ